ncbi:MAG: cytochrome c biogenesis protein ResB [Pelovirga sp.]
MTETQKKQDFTDRIWDFFCSLKLTIILLLLLSVTSIIGTVIPQGASASEYINRYGQSNYELFVKLQFTEMYGSTWFIALLGLFCVNLICCSIKHFPRTWKFFKEPTRVPTSTTLTSSKNKFEISSKDPADVVVNRVKGSIEKNFAKTVQTDIDGKSYLFAQKGIYSRLGAYLTHISIIVILVGAIIGNVFGFKAYVNIPEGDSVSQVMTRDGSQRIDLGFEVRCDNFDVKFYPDTRRPMEYASDLVILKDGDEVYEKRIVVNDPLFYEGIIFYQSSYGQAGDATITFKATDNESGETFEFSAPLNRRVSLSNGYSVIVTDFTDNDRNFGPAMRLQTITPEGARQNPVVIWQNFPEFDVRRGGQYSFAMSSFQQPYFTGLQVAKDPGVNIVWAGCLMLIVGPLVAFFMSHKRIWVCIEHAGKATKIQLAGNAHRNQPGFALAFDDLMQKVETAVNNKPPNEEG